MSVSFHIAVPARIMRPVSKAARFVTPVSFLQRAGRQCKGLSALVLLGSLVLLCTGAGCTTPGTDKRLAMLETRMDSQQYLDIRVTSLEERAAALEHAVGEARASQQSPGSAQKRRPQVAQRPLPTSAPGMELLPQVVPTTAQVIDTTLAELREPLEKELQTVSSGAGHPTGPRQDAPGASATLTASVRREAVQKKAPLASHSASAGTVDTAYNAALALYEAGKHEVAAKQFKEFVAQYPANRLTPNALYWYGECFYSRADFATAILNFKDVVARFPKHSKAAAALYKLGLSYRRLKDDENARFYWQILVEDFPASAPAKLAKQQLSRLSPR